MHTMKHVVVLLLQAAISTSTTIYPTNHTNGTIHCSSSTPCTVICNNGTTTCNNQVINGHAAPSLTVYCGSETCSNLNISCPAAGCTVDCDGDNSCTAAMINYNGTTDDDGVVSLNCHSGHYACYQTMVDAPFVNELNINCSAEYESFNYACHSIVVNAHSADTVNLYATESHGSGEGTFNVTHVDTLTLYARGYLGSNEDVIYAENAGSVFIECVAESPSGSCYDGTWFLPSDAVIDCYGTGCANLGELIVEPDASDLMVSVYSCSQCLDAADCLNSFELTCNSSMETQEFEYGLCDTDGADCGCEELIDNAAFYVAKNADSCYTPIDTISCDEHETDCSITCDNTTSTCDSMVIDGSDAAHLTVHCGSDRYCRFTYIVCPDSGCDVECTANKACHDTTIIYHGDIGDEATVSVDCTVSNACYNTIIDAEDAHTLELVSNANGMYYGVIYVNNAQTVSLNATDEKGIWRSIVYGENVTNMMINCEYDRGCFHNEMYLPNNPEINCYGKGCFNLGYLYFPEVDNEAVWSVDGGCGLCDDLFDCINHFQLECGRYYDGSSVSDYPYDYNYSLSYTFNNTLITDQEFYSNQTCQNEMIQEDCGCYDLMNGDIAFTGCNTPSPTAATTGTTSSTASTETTLYSKGIGRKSIYLSVWGILLIGYGAM